MSLLLCALAAPVAAWAADLSVTVDRREMAVDEQVTLQMSASGDYDEMTAPASDGFDFRQAGRSTQMNLIGGKMDRRETYTFVGTPRREGTWSIGPFVLRSNGKTVARVAEVKVRVLDAREQAGPAVPPEKATDLQQFVGQRYFVRPVLTVDSPFVGQPFTVSWELYWSRLTHVSSIRGVAGPSLVGLEVEDLLPGRTTSQEPVQFSGRPYMRQVASQLVVTAPAAGEYEIVGPRFRIEAGDLFETHVHKLAPPVIRLHVREVPTDGAPPGYVAGNVGRMKMTAVLGRAGGRGVGGPVQVGERIILTVTIEGEGNLIGLAAPPLPVIDDMVADALPERPDRGISRTANGTEGQRVWQTVLHFERPGTYDIPALQWATWDPYDERFIESEAGPFRIEVEGVPVHAQAGSDQVGVAGESPPSDPLHITADQPLRPIVAQADLSSGARPHWTRAGWLWRVVALPWLAALVLGAGALWRSRRIARAPLFARARAVEQARSALQTAAHMEPAEGYAAVRAAVAAWLRTACGLELAGLTFPSLQRELVARGGGADAAQRLVSELEHCDFARFAPTGDRGDDLSRTAERVGEALSEIDGGLHPAQAGGGPAGRAGAVLVGALAFLAVLVAGAPQLQAATLDQEFAAANEAFVAQRWPEARLGYGRLLDHRVESAAVHFNMANTLVKLDRLGEAVGHYARAARLEPDETLAQDIAHNLGTVRARLSERSRRRHRILHVFDESPELDVALARSAPRGLLGFLVLFTAFGALGLYALRLRRRAAKVPRAGVPAANPAWVNAGLGVAVFVHLVAGAWLWHADRVDDQVRHAVVTEEDAPLTACQGVGETVHLPEGLVVRELHTRPDGRVEIRLPNGRAGCVAGDVLYWES